MVALGIVSLDLCTKDLGPARCRRHVFCIGRLVFMSPVLLSNKLRMKWETVCRSEKCKKSSTVN